MLIKIVRVFVDSFMGVMESVLQYFPLLSFVMGTVLAGIGILAVVVNRNPWDLGLVVIGVFLIWLPTKLTFVPRKKAE